MGIAEMQTQIRVYQTRIRGCENENMLLKSKIARLENAQREYCKKQASLEASRWSEKYRSNDCRWASAIKAAPSYADELSHVIEGYDGSGAEEAFCTILKAITNRIACLEDEIRDNSRTMGVLSKEIAYVRTRLAQLV